MNKPIQSVGKVFAIEAGVVGLPKDLIQAKDLGSSNFVLEGIICGYLIGN